MLNPSRLSSLISSTSFPLNRCPPSSGSQSWGYTTRPRGWGIFKRHYGDFCTGADIPGRAVAAGHGTRICDLSAATLDAIRAAARGSEIQDCDRRAGAGWNRAALRDRSVCWGWLLGSCRKPRWDVGQDSRYEFAHRDSWSAVDSQTSAQVIA